MWVFSVEIFLPLRCTVFRYLSSTYHDDGAPAENRCQDMSCGFVSTKLWLLGLYTREFLYGFCCLRTEGILNRNYAFGLCIMNDLFVIVVLFKNTIWILQIVETTILWIKSFKSLLRPGKGILHISTSSCFLQRSHTLTHWVSPQVQPRIITAQSCTLCRVLLSSD